MNIPLGKKYACPKVISGWISRQRCLQERRIAASPAATDIVKPVLNGTCIKRNTFKIPSIKISSTCMKRNRPATGKKFGPMMFRCRQVSLGGGRFLFLQLIFLPYSLWWIPMKVVRPKQGPQTYILHMPFKLLQQRFSTYGSRPNCGSACTLGRVANKTFQK